MFARLLPILIGCIAASSVSYGTTSDTLVSLVRSGSLEKIQEYLSQPGVTINDRPDNDKALLDYAAEQNQTVVAGWLLGHGAAVNAAQTRFQKVGLTALHRAAYFGALEVAQVLIAHGADVNASQPSGSTPLMYAASGGQVKLVQLLLDHHADVTARTGAGQTALSEAAGSGHLDIVQLLQQHGAPADDGRSLNEAASHGRIDVVRALLSATPNSAAKDTALRFAIIMAKPQTDASYLQVISLLLEAGADANNTVNKAPNTPLMLASRADVVGLLVARGADVHAAMPGQGSVLSAAACNKGGDAVGVAREILKHGVDVNTSTNLGTTLHCATWAHLPELQEYLLQNGAQVNSIDGAGRSPIYWADTQLVIDPLLRHGASLSIRDDHGKTPLMSAILEMKAPKTLLLLAAGSDPNETDSEGTTPLAAASERKLAEVVAALQSAPVNSQSQDRHLTNDKLQAAFNSTEKLCGVVRSFSGDAQIDSLIDLTAQMTVRAFNPNDANWTPANPRWLRLHETIKADMAQDLKPEFRRAEQDNLHRCRRAVFDQLSVIDIEWLLHFYSSAQGTRYIDFQRQLGEIQTTAILDYTNRALMGTNSAEPNNEAPESKATDTRKRLLDLSWSTLLSKSGGSLLSSTSPAMESETRAMVKVMLNLALTTKGSELDALQVRYKSDLAQFTKFHQSREFTALLNSIVSSEPDKPEMDRERNRLQAVALSAVRTREPAWQAAFKQEDPHPATKPSDLIVERNGNMTNVRVAGSLAASHPSGCIPLEQLDGSYTPPDLYIGVAECLKQDKYAQAASLFALAGLESRFDAARVTDQTAGQAGQVLIINMFNSLSPDVAEGLRKEVGAMHSDKQSLGHLCESVKAIGYPQYYPSYMVLHGMRAIIGDSKEAALDPGFDPKKTWISLQTTYLDCPTTEVIRSAAGQNVTSSGLKTGDAGARFFSLTLEFKLDGKSYSLAATWSCEKDEASNSTTRGWSTSARTVVRQITDRKAVFFVPPAECEIADAANYDAWLGIFPDISVVESFDIYPAPGLGGGVSGVVTKTVVHTLLKLPPAYSPSALEQKLTRLLDDHNHDYSALTGEVSAESEWRDAKESALVDILEHTTEIASSVTLSHAAFFPMKKSTPQSSEAFQAELQRKGHRPVRVINPVFSNGVWTVTNGTAPQNFVRYMSATTLPSLMGTGVTTPVVLDYKGKIESTPRGSVEFYDPQDKTVVRFNVGYPLLGSMQPSNWPK